MWVGIGVGIGRNRFATGIFNDYALRVNADGGITEAGQCVDAVTGILLNASLLLIPSGYKGGKLYAEIPTNGNGDLTWTRGGDAFRTNASGVLQRVPWNLLSYSEDFSNASWFANGGTIVNNAGIAPNGTLTADRLVLTGTSSLSRSISQSSAGSNSLTNTFSVYVKYIDRPFIQLVWGTGFSTTNYSNFNIQSGSVTAGTYTDATIVNAGDGWYRITITTLGTSTTPVVYVWPVDSSTASRAATSSGGGSYFIWGAQLVEGTTAQTYLPTTDRLNFPRLSYMYGSCPSALLEPQRTNLGTNSQNFADVSWAVLGGSTKGATNLTDPSNNNTACNVTWSAGAGTKYFYGTRTSATGTYTISFYIKSNSGSKFRLYDGVSGSISSDFTATSTFQRYSYTFTQSTGTGGFYGILSASDNSAGDIIVAFAQFELGSYPTTYIPTTSATATRVADSFSRSNIYTNGLISASGGTWFVEFAVNNTNTRDSSQGMFVGDSTNIYTGNQLVILSGSTGTIQLNKVVSGTGTTLYQSSNSQLKFAIKWNGSTADIFANGTKVISATTFTATNMENLIGQSGTPFFIKQMALFNTPLTDAQCQTLTT